MVNLYNNPGSVIDNQELYDNYNNFIFSSDRNIFNKLMSKFYFYNKTKHLLGDIVECGVFKGSGMISWLKLLDLYEPNTIKKVIGFDFFDPSFVDSLSDDTDKETMKQVFSRCENLDINDVSLDGIRNKILSAGIKPNKFDLVRGDVSLTTNKFLCDKPGFRISLLNMDLDLDEPTYHVLKNLWDNIVPGGIIIFDEYAYHNWSEANGVDDFIRELDGVKLIKTNMSSPSAYMVKL